MFKRTKWTEVNFKYEYEGSAGSSQATFKNIGDFASYLEHYIQRHGNLIVSKSSEDVIEITTAKSAELGYLESRINDVSELIRNYIKERAVEMDAYAVFAKGELKGVFGQWSNSQFKKASLLRKGYGNKKTPLYTITIIADTLREDFFLIENHLEKFKKLKTKRPAEWTVVSIEETEAIEEVYCAVVPDGHAFTLDGNIFTGNCGGFCVRGGQGHFANLLKHNRDLFLYHEQREQDIRELIGKDVSILRKQRKGVRFNYTLRDLRHDIEGGNEEEVEMTDIGGCGCFVTDDGEMV